MTLDERRVLITGGGTGIGADLARGFAAAGADVVVVGRRLDAARRRGGQRCTHHSPSWATSPTKPTCVSVFTEVEPVDIVVANAGAAESAPLGKTSIDLWHRMIDVNLTGVFLTLPRRSAPDALAAAGAA